jgi:hypothetical protein
VAGCGTGGSRQVFSVAIVNDTGAPVVVRDCDDYCSSSPIELELVPGASAPINRVATQHKSFSITNSSGEHIGCLDLYYTAPQPGARALVSRAVPCSGKPRPLWQTVGLVAALVAVLALPFVLVRRR